MATRANGKRKPEPTLTVEQWPIDRVIPYARNPRKNGEAVAKVAASLKEFGWRQPLVVDKARVLIVGHTRLLAARQLDMATVPVHVAKDMTPSKAKAYRIMDNKSSESAEWDSDLLALEFNDLELDSFDMDLTGFNPGEIAKTLGRGDILNPAEAWQGMPEFVQEDQMPHRTIHVHFASDSDAADFARLIGQPVTEQTKTLWHPAQRPVRRGEYASDAA